MKQLKLFRKGVDLTRKVPCPLCSNTFVYSDSLGAHMRVRHRIFGCVCGVQLSRHSINAFSEHLAETADDEEHKALWALEAMGQSNENRFGVNVGIGSWRKTHDI